MSERESAPDERDGGIPSDPLFREEAVREYLRVRTRGELLRISPAWADWVFWLLLTTAAGALAFMTLARVEHVVSAPAIVQALASPEIAGAATGRELEVVARFSPDARAHVTVGAPIRVRAGSGGFPPLELRVAAVSSSPGEAALLAHAPIPPATDAASHGLAAGAHAVAEVRAGQRTILELLLGRDAP